MHENQRPQPHARSIPRSSALRVLGTLGGAALLCGCAGASGSVPSTGNSDLADASSCGPTPEGEIGPYFTDDSATGYDRSNILSNLDGSTTQTGVPFTLTITVNDAHKSCTPMQGVQIDVWHCNAAGIYSNESIENSSDENWLRGYQLTDAQGQATFTTIIPGWYAGRTTHIHLRLRSSYSEASSTSDGVNTTQVFFPQSLIDELSTSVAPYNAEGANPTTNATDHVYVGETAGATLMAPAGSISGGYTAAVVIDLPIAAAT